MRLATANDRIVSATSILSRFFIFLGENEDLPRLPVKCTVGTRFQDAVQQLWSSPGPLIPPLTQLFVIRVYFHTNIRRGFKEGTEGRPPLFLPTSLIVLSIKIKISQKSNFFDDVLSNKSQEIASEAINFSKFSEAITF